MIGETPIHEGTKYCCVVCNKQYTKKTSLEKHKLLCDFKMKTKREQQIESEELGDLPDHLHLVKIVQELAFKIIKMEERMVEIQKWVDKKKKKLNVIGWLNTNVDPSTGFREWINTCFIVLPEYFEDLMENKLYNTIQKVFEYNLRPTDDFVYPLRSFSEKQGTIYICEKNADGCPQWQQMEFSDMVLMLKVFQSRMIKEVTRWKCENQHRFDDSPKICELFNKAVIKLMDISFKQDPSFSRIKNGLYNYLKTDLKACIEYEFEF